MLLELLDPCNERVEHQRTSDPDGARSRALVTSWMLWGVRKEINYPDVTYLLAGPILPPVIEDACLGVLVWRIAGWR